MQIQDIANIIKSENEIWRDPSGHFAALAGIYFIPGVGEIAAAVTVVLDFNYAFLPPCSFNQSPLFPCPLPPAQNRLAFEIEAGERKPLLKEDSKKT